MQRYDSASKSRQPQDRSVSRHREISQEASGARSTRGNFYFLERRPTNRIYNVSFPFQILLERLEEKRRETPERKLRSGHQSFLSEPVLI